MNGPHPDHGAGPAGEPALDDLLRVLAAAPQADELAREAAVVAAMRARIVPAPAPSSPLGASKEPAVHASSTRRARIVTIAAAAVLAVGGVAAAAPPDWVPGKGGPDFLDQLPEGAPPQFETPAVDESTTTLAATTTAVTTTTAAPATTTTVAGLAPTGDTSTSTSLVDDPDTAFDETQCAEGNHGKTVSSVAQSVEPGPDHGPAVAEAAHSSCGKSAKADDEQDTEDGPEATETEDDGGDDDGGKPDDAGKPDHAGKPDDAGSRGNGHGNGGSHGHDDDSDD